MDNIEIPDRAAVSVEDDKYRKYRAGHLGMGQVRLHQILTNNCFPLTLYGKIINYSYNGRKLYKETGKP